MFSAKTLISSQILESAYQKGYVVPLVISVPFQRDIWRLAKQYLAEGDGFFLDGEGSGGKNARFSYLGFHPFLIYQPKHGEELIPMLRKRFQNLRGLKWPGASFFTGGACGFLSYELARAFEDLPQLAEDDLKLNPAALLFVQDLFVFDHEEQTLFLVANLIPGREHSFAAALEKAEERIARYLRSIREGEDSDDFAQAEIDIQNFRPDISKAHFKRMVKRAKTYIKAGDIYQANLSQRFSFSYQGRPETLYESLRRINPSPFSCFLKIGDVVIASASPERLVKLDGKHCETRPIAGTRPRGITEEEDELLRQELIMSPKERAEHIMLVDLERNDLGRVCEAGSVRVSELMTLEPYSHVVHIVSNVVGTLKEECDRFDLLKAVFPGGTITGCPKIRSMEIIEELEPFKRHIYTGSIGFFDFNGDMDLNIVIRSFVFKGNKGYLQVGAGIVHDSDPEQEYRETLHKAEALIEALGEAVIVDGSEHGQLVR